MFDCLLQLLLLLGTQKPLLEIERWKGEREREERGREGGKGGRGKGRNLLYKLQVKMLGMKLICKGSSVLYRSV